jgi:hypothetical protein
MTSDDEKIKANPAPKNKTSPKNETSPKKKSASGIEAKSGETAAEAPSGYSRVEGQKPVSKAYKDNWNLIFAKKKK